MIIEKKAVEFITEGSLEYSSYIALNRVLPTVQDGLKPIQRKIIWSMWDMRATDFTKSANVSGNTFKYSPHGDSYLSLLPITQQDSIQLPLVIGRGNWGFRTSRDLMPASSRYTECKLSPFSIEALKAISNGGAQMIDNYDSSKKMPADVPFDIPFALVAANQGIGMGLASNTFSYNLSELCDATISHLNGKEIGTIAPDFPTGGEMANNQEVFEQIMERGSGGIVLYPTICVNGQTISITEIPYYTTREQVVEAILKKVQDKTFPEIKEVLDLCGLNGFLIEIEIKKGHDANKTLDKLWSSGVLTTKSSANYMMLGLDGKPKVHGVRQVIKDWCSYKSNSIRMELSVEKSRLESELIKLSALEAVVVNIDKFIETLRSGKSKELPAKISSVFKICEEQAAYLIKLPMSQLNEDVINQKLEEIQSKKQRLAHIENITDAQINSIIAERVKIVQDAYPMPRKTKLVPARAVTKKTYGRPTEQKKTPENSVVFLTQQGFLTKLPENTKVETIKLAPGDEVVYSGYVSSGAYVVSLGGGCANKFYIDDIKVGKGSELGTFLSDKKSFVVSDEMISVVVLFEDGRAINLAKSVFDTTSKRKTLKGFSEKKIVDIKPIYHIDEEVVFINDKGQFTMKSSDIRLSTGKSGNGAFPKSKKNSVSLK